MNRNSHGVHRVVIIGAGVSGLACARELVQRGYKVVVVEARARPGGRLKTSPLDLGDNDEILVDMGGALIHGIDENPIATLVHDVLGESTQKVQETLLMTDSGWPVDPKEDERTAQAFDDSLEEAFRRAKEPDAKPDESFGSILNTVWKERSVTADALLKWYKSNLELSCGVGLQRLGLEFNDDEAYGFEGDHVAMQRSWQPVVEALARGIDILYNSEVSTIQVVHPKEYPRTRTKVMEQQPIKKANPKSPSPSKKKPRALPSTDTATTSSAVTTKSTPFFTAIPPAGTIPLRQSRRLRGEDAVLRRSVRSTKGKFDNRYVVPEESGAKKSSEPNPSDEPEPKTDKKKRPRVMDPVKEERKEPTSTTVFVTLKSGKVLEADSVVCTLPLAMLQQRQVDFHPPLPEKKQEAIDSLGGGLLNKCALSFAQPFWPSSDFLGLADRDNSYLVLNIHRITGKPCLVFMYGGDFAETIESWDDREIVQDCLRVLGRICSVRRVPDPLDYHVTRWGKEMFSAMSFSYIPPGVKAFETILAVSEPMLDSTGEKPVLQFAGEHTTPFHTSTIHGAFLSGIREAYRLDCAVDPEGTGFLEFSEEEIYEPTFNLAKDKKASEASPVAKAAPEPPARQVGVVRKHRGKHMRLRARSTQSQKENPQTKRESTEPSSDSPPRNSRYQFGRLSKGGAAASMGSPANNNNGEETEVRDLEAMEDRILLRCLESYGDDFEYIREKALPIYGSDRKRTVSQVQSRCRKVLRESKKVAGKSKAARIRKEWFSATDENLAKPPNHNT